MNFKKRVNGSWIDTPHYIHNTSTDTITIPADIYANDTTATVGLKGQMVQSSTPTPTTPIQLQECGDRTANLFDINKLDSSITVEGESFTKPITGFFFDIFSGSSGGNQPINVNKSIFLKAGEYVATVGKHPSVIAIMRVNDNEELSTIATIATTQSSASFTLNYDSYVTVRISKGESLTISNLEISAGSTAPAHYEPYGYKIPILNNSQTTNVYLGEVQSTRRIKKLVLTGNESITAWTGAGSGYFYIYTTGIITFGITDKLWLSNQYSAKSQSESWGNYVISCNPSVQGRLVIKNTDYPTVADFKAYLAQQYAAGTPVTVWYVLATETTGIVNEPLRKIGDYADEVSNVSIPTIAGANAIDVLTTLKPSEVSVNYHGWHPISAVHERENGAWT